MNVTGIAAVLDRPMRGRPVTLTAPSPLLTTAGTPVIRDGAQVGTVTRAWVDEDLVRWEGHIPPPTLTWIDVPDCDLVPPVEPTVCDLIAMGRLVGITDLVQAQMRTLATGSVLSDWSVAGVTLLPWEDRPWPELHLGLAR